MTEYTAEVRLQIKRALDEVERSGHGDFSYDDHLRLLLEEPSVKGKGSIIKRLYSCDGQLIVEAELFDGSSITVGFSDLKILSPLEQLALEAD